MRLSLVVLPALATLAYAWNNGGDDCQPTTVTCYVTTTVYGSGNGGGGGGGGNANGAGATATVTVTAQGAVQTVTVDRGLLATPITVPVMSILTVFATVAEPVTVPQLSSTALTSPTTIPSGTSTVRTTSTAVQSVALNQSNSAAGLRPLLATTVAPIALALLTMLLTMHVML